jgi:argininosuccinate synthase
MAQENIIGAMKLPAEVLQKVLPVAGDTVVLGEETHTKIEYLGKGYIIHWKPVVHIAAIGDLDAIEADLTAATKQAQGIAEAKAHLEDLKARFNSMTATPVTCEAATTEGAPLKVVR